MILTMQKECSIDGCGKLAHKRGYCNAHYQRERSAGRLPLQKGDPCSMEDCNGSAYARGLCNKHYRRLMQHGDPSVLLKKPIQRTETHKECVTCREMLPLEAFNKASSAKDGRQGHCRVCARAANGSWYDENRAKAREDAKRWNRENPERAKDHHYKVRYGITFADFQEMHAAQGGVCAICEKPQPRGRRLYVDHDHYTGKVRALLCYRCNSGIGNFLENPALLHAAAKYLDQHSI